MSIGPEYSPIIFGNDEAFGPRANWFYRLVRCSWCGAVVADDSKVKHDEFHATVMHLGNRMRYVGGEPMA